MTGDKTNKPKAGKLAQTLREKLTRAYRRRLTLTQRKTQLLKVVKDSEGRVSTREVLPVRFSALEEQG